MTKSSSSSKSRSGINNGMYGKHHSEESKAKIRKAKLGTKRPELSGIDHPLTKIYQGFTLLSPSGEVYKEIISLAMFSKKHGLYKNNLYKVLTKKNKIHKGWKLLPSASNRLSIKKYNSSNV